MLLRMVIRQVIGSQALAFGAFCFWSWKYQLIDWHSVGRLAAFCIALVDEAKVLGGGIGMHNI